MTNYVTAADGVESSTTSQEYCEDETFTATCGNQQVVVMESARCVIISSVQLNTTVKEALISCCLLAQWSWLTGFKFGPVLPGCS